MKHSIKQLLPAFVVIVAFLSFIISQNAQAAPIVINPVDDGSIYSSGSVITYQYLMPSGDIQGVVEFSTSALNSPISQALLSVNPYGLPLWGPTVQVFGYASNDGTLTFSDYNEGTFIGSWELPDTLDYGQDAFFDVTQFMQGVTSPYVGFNLRTISGGTDVFSSLEYNYGHASQLIVSSVPEPGSILLFLLGISALGFAGWQRKRKNRTLRIA